MEGRVISTIPEELEEIPQSYFSAASEQGQLVNLNYDTYESFSYEQKSQKLTKHAIVYLPYTYNGLMFFWNN